MSAITLSIIAIIVYTIATSLQFAVFQGKLPQRPVIATILGVSAVIAHSAGLSQPLAATGGLDLNLGNSLSACAVLVSGIVTLFALSKPVHNLKLICFPISVLVIVFSLNDSGPSQVLYSEDKGVLIHAALSVVSYALFSMAAIQASLLYCQNKQLKSHHPGRLVLALPPLQTTEAILFEMLWTGFALLTLAILSGMIFVDNLFDQHLAHKTILTLAAWLLFGFLLAGRKLKGWRGMIAAKITMLGFTLLLFGYFGSKFVLEVLLQR